MIDEQLEKLVSRRGKVMLSWGLMRDSGVTGLHLGSWCSIKSDAADRYMIISMMGWSVLQAAAANTGGAGQSWSLPH